MQAISTNSSLLCKLLFMFKWFFFSQLIVLLLLPTHTHSRLKCSHTPSHTSVPLGSNLGSVSSSLIYIFFYMGSGFEIQTTRQQRDHTSPCSQTTQLQMFRRVRQTAGWWKKKKNPRYKIRARRACRVRFFFVCLLFFFGDTVPHSLNQKQSRG